MTGPNNSYELKISLNEKLVEAFSKALVVNEDAPESIKSSVKIGSFVGLEEIEWLHKHTKDVGKFHELLTGVEVVLPHPVEKPRDPVLEARVKKLKAEQEEREYRKMTKNVDSVRRHQPDDTIGYQLRQMNKQMIAVLQFVFSVVAGFVFGFLGIELIVGDLEFGFRLLLGVIFSLIIALAEIYFLAKKLAEEMDPTDDPSHKLHYD
uniref:Putative endoplasmic reticulum-based factor for assembly of v-atpase n=1 Tax=Panstrongylus lignarius TaxID=156445 RepID=A0A224XY16_9HEMI